LLKWLCKETFAVAREQSVAITKKSICIPFERHCIKPHDNLQIDKHKNIMDFYDIL
jgi:hypothetical protein